MINLRKYLNKSASQYLKWKFIIKQFSIWIFSAMQWNERDLLSISPPNLEKSQIIFRLNLDQNIVWY